MNTIIIKPQDSTIIKPQDSTHYLIEHTHSKVFSIVHIGTEKILSLRVILFIILSDASDYTNIYLINGEIKLYSGP